MSIFADMAIDHLCRFTFRPDGSHDPDDMAEVERAAWQTLIQGLSPAEHLEATIATQRQVDKLRSMPRASLPAHLRMQLDMLEGFLRNELS